MTKEHAKLARSKYSFELNSLIYPFYYSDFGIHFDSIIFMNLRCFYIHCPYKVGFPKKVKFAKKSVGDKNHEIFQHIKS